jgi:hypothetical protein
MAPVWRGSGKRSTLVFRKLTITLIAAPSTHALGGTQPSYDHIRDRYLILMLIVWLTFARVLRICFKGGLYGYQRE